MTQTPNPQHDEQAPDLPSESMAPGAGQRGRDDRKQAVNPAENPAPISPELDDDALREGEDGLNSISPH